MKGPTSSHDGFITIAMIDLDDFKLINEHSGHAVGDRALLSFADRLRAAFREVDGIFRMGGDEFLILTNSLPAGVFEKRLQTMRQGEFPPNPGISGILVTDVGFSFGIASAQGDVALDGLMMAARIASSMRPRASG